MVIIQAYFRKAETLREKLMPMETLETLKQAELVEPENELIKSFIKEVTEED